MIRHRLWTHRLLTIVLTAVLATPGPATAQLGARGGGPIEIEADQALEWLRDEQRYVARGNAEVRQGGDRLRAAVITAFYRDGPDGQPDIYRIEAVGNVVAVSGDARVSGDRAIYEVASDRYDVRGAPAIYEAPMEIVSAWERLIYDGAARRAEAIGDAVVLQDEDRVEADRLIAQYGPPDAGGAPQLQTITADGAVVITTPNDIATGRQATYDVASRVATLEGDVQITQGENQLSGDRAEVNLETGVRRLLSAPDQGNSRIRVLLVPGSGDS